MSELPVWQYDEFEHCGVDYNDVSQVAAYDRRHQQFRDYKKQTMEMVETLGLNGSQTVIDMACGTGAFAINAAAYCRQIYAVDVSRAMLDCTAQKVQQAKIKNISFHQGGFLTYEHSGEPSDAIVSIAALHHLPDFWKQIALRRMAAMLKTGGKFNLFDVVFSFKPDNYQPAINEWIKSITANENSEISAEAITHIAKEFSTFDWIMEEMLQRAGFEIESKNYKDGFFASYLCVKK
ncbi:MAG: methyltransferase domain-containing protein [Phycisphaerae bacterium]|nr:methyltransferase domain-containing protein [Phycisphaerae bacterium]